MGHVQERLLTQPTEDRTDPQGALARLRDVAGLDVSMGLRLVAQREGLYLRLLQRFVEEHADAPAKIAAAQGRGDAESAERIAHTLKGVAAQIGAQALQESAASLEAALRSGAPLMQQQALREQTALLLELLVRDLRARLPG